MAKDNENRNLPGENNSSRENNQIEGNKNYSPRESNNTENHAGDYAQGDSREHTYQNNREGEELGNESRREHEGASGNDIEPYDRLQRHNQSAGSPNASQGASEPPSSPSPSTGKNVEPYENKTGGGEDKTEKSDKPEASDSSKQKNENSSVTPRRVRKPKGSTGGSVVAAGASAATGALKKGKDKLQAKDTFGEEEETDDKPKKDKKGGLAGGAKKLAGAAAAKAGIALKGLLLSPKGLLVILIALLAVIAVVALLIVSSTVERTIAHTKKYGCVEDKFTLDFLEQLSPGNGETISSQIGDLFSDTESSCSENGAGWTGEFYPPTIGSITSYWYYDNGKFHGATDIAAYEGAPIFAYAGGEVISRVDGTANAVGDQGNCSDFAPWAYAATVQGDIRISHQPGILESRYVHMWKKDMTARVGDIVSAGDQIAGQGNSGWSCGTHLHFQLEENGERVDPYYHMKDRGINYPISLDTLPPKPEGGGDANGENSESVDVGLMSYAAKMMKENGISPSSSEKTCLAKLWNRESGWRHTATNPSSGAYGIPQSLPGDKMASEGSDWRTNPQTQIRWGIKYIKNRYGTPCGAWAHSEAKNWY